MSGVLHFTKVTSSPISKMERKGTDVRESESIRWFGAKRLILDETREMESVEKEKEVEGMFLCTEPGGCRKDRHRMRERAGQRAKTLSTLLVFHNESSLTFYE